VSVDVWAAWPTISPMLSRPQVEKWRELGYKVAVLVNPPFGPEDFERADMVIVQEEWTGFPVAANVLCLEAPGDVVVIVGTDIDPDTSRTAQELGGRFLERFPDLCGVIQPTGDEYGEVQSCAVSPWIGRGFIEKAYGGRGPYWPGYFHYFCDRELQAKAQAMGAFEQWPQVIQYHRHWQREAQPRRPRHLRTAKRLHSRDRAIFESRQAEGFPDGR